jgi:hypothetical protein
MQIAPRSSRRLLHLVVEIIVGTLSMLAFVVYLMTRPPGTAVDLRPTALVVNTAIVFGYLIAWFRQYWKRWLFWASLMMLLLFHVLGFAICYGFLHDLPMVYYAAIDVGELAVSSYLLRKILFDWEHWIQRAENK